MRSKYYGVSQCYVLVSAYHPLTTETAADQTTASLQCLMSSPCITPHKSQGRLPALSGLPAWQVYCPTIEGKHFGFPSATRHNTGVSDEKCYTAVIRACSEACPDRNLALRLSPTESLCRKPRLCRRSLPTYRCCKLAAASRLQRCQSLYSPTR